MSSDTFHVASCIFLCSRSTLSIIMQLWLMRNFWSNDFRRQDSLLENVRIWSYSRPHFSAFGLNIERYGVILRIDFKCGKMWTRKTPNTDTFFPYLRWTYLLRLMFVRTSNQSPGKFLLCSYCIIVWFTQKNYGAGWWRQATSPVNKFNCKLSNFVYS